ncbi:MAG TPA: RbsD/FucU domain-containing protein, partial [Alkalispirochaeta sp.]|nr:RbsD/FucU domain-containing protein [Alkalispirochaeta sp.]
VDEPVIRMEVVGAPDELVGCHKDMQNVVDGESGRSLTMGHIERHAFYERARDAFAVVAAAGERRPYGCFIITKGVIAADGRVG